MEFDPAGVNAAVPLVPAGAKLAVAFVGTPAGHATVPAGVNAAVAFVPVAVSVCVCVASAEPVKTSAGTVRFGAVAFAAVNDPVPAAMFVAALLPLVVVAAFVPPGVPALTALDVADDPVKTSAGTVPALPEKVGTPAGQEITSAGMVPELPVNISAATVPGVPVNVGAATVPAGVNAAVPFVPAGVMLFDPPAPPTSPFAASVP